METTSMAVGPDLTALDGALGEDEVHVWHSDLKSQDSAFDRALQLLDQPEQVRAKRFLVPEPRVQFVLSRAFLRVVLGKYLGIEPRAVTFKIAEHGKPELANPSGLFFNLSHTDGATLIAVTRAGRVGVDIEKIRQNLEPLALGERFFSRQESDWLRAQPPEGQFAAFFGCWTAKEAYVKACGGGLSIALDSFGVIRGGESEIRLEIYDRPEESRKWSMWPLELGVGLKSAVAVEATNCRLRLGRWRENSF